MRIKSLLSLMTVLALIIFAMILAPVAHGATANPSPASTGYETVVLYVPGAITSTATPIAWKSPWPYRVLSISAYARSITTTCVTTPPSYSIQVKQGTTNLLSPALAILTTQAATVLDGVLTSAPNITDEATVSVLLTLAGESPSITDLTLIMSIKRQ